MDRGEEEFRQPEEPRTTPKESNLGGIMRLGFNLGMRGLKLGKELGGKFLTEIGSKTGIAALKTTLFTGASTVISGGTALAAKIGLGLVKRGIGFLANLGISPEPGKRDGGCLIAAGAIAVLAGLFILSLFSSLQTMTFFTVRPHQSQKRTTLGVTKEKISTPSATPQPEVNHPLDDTFIPEP